MIAVQKALAPTGMPCYAAIWKPTAEHAVPPDQYLVYSSTTTEDEHYDDQPISTQTYVYLNLWSLTDPTDAAKSVRRAMRAAGFSMMEESDKGYNHPAYNVEANLFTVGWTWVYREAIDDGV